MPLNLIDIDHQARDRARAPLSARKLFLQALLQVTAVVPAGEEIRDPGAQESRAIHRVLDAHGRDRTQVGEEIGAVVARESDGIAAAEAQRARGEILARQRHERRAPEIPSARKQQMMIRADERTEPGLMQCGELRRQADQRIDEEYLLEFLRPIAAGHQQMTDLVLGIQ